MMQNEDVKIQFLAQIDGEVLMLHKLMIITIAGCALASLLAVLAGLVLAERALKPNKAAWDKQTQFVSDASHEIRTPLASIRFMDSKRDTLSSAINSFISQASIFPLY
ncbi:histidine kinase dimerization/phospho-acceptor domain-containing protein [Heyndrickxia coagulans]|nr:histidine kinase dimerization/phospho-acceptor domain-containing protein [Heyndrickxia coagulans]